MTERAALDGLYGAHRVLAKLDVPHGLIGGWAAIAWGRVRATRDVDWMAEFAPSKIKMNESMLADACRARKVEDRLALLRRA